MAEAILFNAARTKAIEDNSIESGFVDVNGKLILVKHNGVQVDAGNVKGPKGDDSRFLIPNNVSATTPYIRIATLDGLNALNGAHYNAMISGLGNSDSLTRGTVLFHAVQRGVGNISLKAWSWDLNPAWGITLYTRKLGDFLYEIWIKFPQFQTNVYLTELASWNTIRNLDSSTTTAPSDLVTVTIESVSASYRGTSVQRDAIYGVPSTDAQRVALANQKINWFNTDLGWTEMYYAPTGTPGLTVPGRTSGGPAGWYSTGPARILNATITGGTIDASGVISPTGTATSLKVDNVFSPAFRQYRLSGKITTSAVSRIIMQFIKADGTVFSTMNVHWQAMMWAQNGFSSPQVFSSNNDPGGVAALGISASPSVLGHSFELLVNNPAYAEYTQASGTFGFHGGAVGSGSFHGGIEEVEIFRGFVITTSAGKITIANSNLVIEGVV